MAKLYFRFGAVGSAKTLNLIAVAHSYEFQGKKVVIAKPDIDTRFGVAEVKSRANLVKTATLVIKSDTVLSPHDFRDVHCLVVDEAQFLSSRHIDMFRMIADSGCPVICYGLRTDFRSNLFEGSRRLMEIADSIEEVKTTCAFCNKKAVLNLKLVGGKATLSGAQIEMGCEETYLPVCSRHYGERTCACEGADELYYAGVLSALHASPAPSPLDSSFEAARHNSDSDSNNEFSLDTTTVNAPSPDAAASASASAAGASKGADSEVKKAEEGLEKFSLARAVSHGGV